MDAARSGTTSGIPSSPGACASPAATARWSAVSESTSGTMRNTGLPRSITRFDGF